MAVFEMWKNQFVFILSLICCGTSESESGQQCLWLNDTSSSCEMCKFSLEGRFLNCFNRTLTTVTLSVSNHIVGLNVSHNQLETSPQILDCPNLEWIDLSYNTGLKVLKSETFRNMKSSSLKMINMNNCGILKVVSKPIEDILPNLMILLISNNSFRQFNASFLQKLKNFKVLDLRGNSVNQETSFCELIEQNVFVLVNEPSRNWSSNHSASCAQIHNICQFHSLASLQPFCQENASVTNYSQSSFHCAECSAGMTTSVNINSYTTRTVAGGSGAADLTTKSKLFSRTEEYKDTLISVSCAVFVALLFLISYQLRKIWKRKRRQNQYNRWLAVYTPPECVSSYQKRVSFSGEIVIKGMGENITKKKLYSDDRKQRRQFDVNLLIRTQSLPPQLTEGEDKRPSRVVSWI